MAVTDLIDMLDEKFRAVVKLEFDKDIEYGYKYLVDLSGGLDSRMTSWVDTRSNKILHTAKLTVQMK